MRIPFFRMICLVSSISFMVSTELMSQDFTETAITLTGVYSPSVDWGDFNNDGYPDVAIMGSSGSMVYKNNGDNTFTALSGIVLPGNYQTGITWGDCDNDGDLDLLVSGAYQTRLYVNNGNETFTEKTDHGLPVTIRCRASWADYDNDGYSDILFTGYDVGWNYLTRLYRNNKDNTFTEKSEFQIQSVVNGSNTWGDFDNDGDLDILLSGYNQSIGQLTKIYRNDGNTFTDINAGLPGVEGTSVFGDYDNDGDLDILISGRSWSLGSISRIYRNDAGLFTDISAGLTGITYGAAAAWADYDNDGDLDVLLAGESGTSTYILKVYRNNGGIFADINAPLTGVYEGAIAWGDYDKDGDLDILLSGSTASGSISKIYRNNNSTKNTAPSAPSGLAVTTGANTVSFSWNKSTDTQTSQNGLTYNLYIGTTAGAVNKRSPMAAVPAGTLRKPRKGEIQSNSWKIKGLPSGTYYWSVQAVDNGLTGSAFATEGSFFVPFSNSIAPVSNQYVTVLQNISLLTATESSTPTSRLWKVASVSGGPYNTLGVTTTTCGPSFATTGVYYVVCESMYGGIAYPSNEVKVVVSEFTEQTGIVLPGVRRAGVNWGDYDSDSDLDLIITGDADTAFLAEIYRNDAGVFTNIHAGLLGVNSGMTDWGDFDNDGDLDLIVAGHLNATPNTTTRIYRNVSGVFTDINAGLIGLRDGSVKWGDYDNDGDLDVLITGYNDDVQNILKLYRNDGGVFTDTNSPVSGGSAFGSVDWGDYDNDGDLDILTSGYNSTDYTFTRIYRNDNGSFTNINANLVGVQGSTSWGDYDGDGDLDILVTGSMRSMVYKNDVGVFTILTPELTGIINGVSSWGDYDNDGDLDIIIAGGSALGNITIIYRNDSGIFTQAVTPFPGVALCSVKWGDYDKDGDLDLVLAGNQSSGVMTKIYKNNASSANAVPSTPTGLTSTPGSNKVTLAWTKSTDSKTPQNGLTYNLYIGTTTGSVNKKSPMAALPGGYRRVVQRGIQTNSWVIKQLPAGTYYWSVQAIDNNFAGSAFATEGSFTVAFANSIAPVADQTLLPGQNGTPLTVTESSAPTARQWKYSTVSGGPYDQVIAGATGTSYTPSFPAFGTYYVVCVSNKSAVDYISNEIKISVPAFTEKTGIVLPRLHMSSTAFGDYDNDGDLDILLSGNSSSDGLITRIYENNAGSFTDINAGLMGLYHGATDWGDYDNDGDLDLVMIGRNYNSGTYAFSKVYRNDAGSFVEAGVLQGVFYGCVSWGDYDNDGDLDILLSGGNESGTYFTSIYRNNAGSFTNISAGLTVFNGSSAEWGDYDNDGDIDILISGYISSTGPKTIIYRNSGGLFSEITTSLPGTEDGSVKWGDYDNDGDLDILVSGNNSTKIFRNNGDNTFSEQTGITLPGVYNVSAAWGDYDNDGDIDLVICGSTTTRVFRNNGDNTFTEQPGATLTGVNQGSVSMGDYDDDGDLDILVTGNYTAKVYRNNSLTVNTAPGVPTNLTASSSNISLVSLKWDKATDSKTPQNALTYNVRVGTTSGGGNITSPMSSDANGYRRIPARGNTGQKNEYFLKNLPAGLYYWSVQAVDQAYAGGTWSEEGQFYLLAAPVAGTATSITETSFTANWTASIGATGYRIDVATDTTFNNILTSYNNKDIGNVTSTSISGLTRSTAYFYRIRAYNVGGTSIVTSNIIKTNTTGIPVAPVAQAASDIVQVSFTANWASSSYASGYKLDVSTNNTFSSFVSGFSDKDVGNVTSFSVTGLTANTIYYYRVRAYNTYGTSVNSSAIAVTTLMNPPATPGGLTATSCNDVVSIQWTAISDANFYRYYIYSGTTPNPTVIWDSTTSILSVSRGYSGLTRGTTHYFRIKAVNTGKIYSSFSNEVSVIVKKGVVPKIKAKWNNVLICYNIGDSLTTWQWYKNNAVIPTATKQFYVTNKAPGTYYVYARDKSNCYNSSNSINITGAKSAYFYPNPAGTNVTMSLTGEDYGRTIVRFYNSQGVKVLEYQAEKTDFELRREIALKSLQNGTYTIEVLVNDEYVDYSRIVIIK